MNLSDLEEILLDTFLSMKDTKRFPEEFIIRLVSEEPTYDEDYSNLPATICNGKIAYAKDANKLCYIFTHIDLQRAISVYFD